MYSPLENKATRPLKTGFRQQHGVNVSGGSDVGTYYLSAGYESEDGVFRLPKFEEDSIRDLLGSVPQTQIRPNALEKLSLRANLTGNLSKNADVSAELGYMSSNSRFVENDNSFLTITGSAEASGAPARQQPRLVLHPGGAVRRAGQPGRRAVHRRAHRQLAARPAGSRPGPRSATTWSTGTTSISSPPARWRTTCDNRAGVIIDNRFQISQTTVDLGGTARFQLSPAVGSKTSVGGQFFRDLATGTFASGRGLTGRLDTIAGAANTDASEPTRRVPLRRRLRRGGDRAQGAAVRHRRPPVRRQQRLRQGLQRHDVPQGQRLLADVGRAVLRQSSFINTLRLPRRAWASAGSSPAPPTRSGSSHPTPGRKDGAAITGVTVGNLGNPDLKPERSREFEVGADAGFFKDRVTVELTYYNKRTKDALILRPIAGSPGAPAASSSTSAG